MRAKIKYKTEHCGSRVCYQAMANYLIIGASSGIGEELALQLSAGGHKVYGTYHTHPKRHPGIEFHALNVIEEHPSLDFLPDTLDGLVYCPGTINLRAFARIPPSDFMKDYALNVGGAIKIIQGVLPKLKAGVSPSIVLFSTVAVKIGLPFHTQVAASKGAIEGLTKALAAELAPTVRVNCIAPSLTDTPLAATLLNTAEKKDANAQKHPLKKIGTAADIANMAEFLLSARSAWISGQIMAVDGGLSSIKA
jgi:NAD(P)-dependent dehydrogenase (short-subunit alcohol dehydrogenase family)